jgi:hypothetical protein
MNNKNDDMAKIRETIRKNNRNVYMCAVLYAPLDFLSNDVNWGRKIFQINWVLWGLKEWKMVSYTLLENQFL